MGAWVTCQIGAREHYAIPRALFRRGLLERLITDAWGEVGARRSEARGRRSGFSSQFSAFKSRYHPELADAPVRAFTGSLVMFELLARLRGLHGWERTIARNQWFERKAVAELRCQRPEDGGQTCKSGQRKAEKPAISNARTVFAYSYAAREIFRQAKDRGWRTVLGQIDPGPVEEDIVAQEAKREVSLAPEWERAPAKYWQNWREECDLADYIVANSNWSRECLTRAGIPLEKIRIIPLAYENSDVGGQKTDVRWKRIYPERFTAERPLRVLFLGQINLRKGVARLLQAMRALRDEPVELRMVGPVQIKQTAEVSSHSRIRWVGPVARQNTERFYAEADVFILPTLSDGFALTQLEAMAHRLPVIASRRCGEVVEHGVNGLLLNEPSASAIEAALRFCLNHAQKLAHFSEAAGLKPKFTLREVGEEIAVLAA